MIVHTEESEFQNAVILYKHQAITDARYKNGKK